MQKYVVYVQNETEDLLEVNAESFVNGCESWLNVLALFLEYLDEDQELYGWKEETLKKMVVDLATHGVVDMLNGRFLYVVPWDGTRDAIEVALEHDKAKRG